MSRQTFGRRVNQWLAEPKGETFKDGKWRFWFPMVIAFSILNGLLTALVFGQGNGIAANIGAIVISVGALLAWIAVGALHYSDSSDPRLARDVAVLDSVSLLCMAAHFCFLLWVYGHTQTLQTAEAKYRADSEAFNTKAEKVQEDNAKIAEAATKIAELETKRAKIENDTAYQARKAAQAGAKIQTGRSGGSAAAGLQTSQVELVKPPEAPEDSSAAYLSRWDALVRLANFGELALAIITLIYIRVRTSRTNTPIEEDFPEEIDTGDIGKRSPSRRGELARRPQDVTTHVSLKNDDTAAHKKTTQGDTSEGLKRLRECLKLIAFQYGPTHFKVDLKSDYLWIRQIRSEHGEARTIASAKARLDILADAMTMPREAFKTRLENFLRENNFEI